MNQSQRKNRIEAEAKRKKKRVAELVKLGRTRLLNENRTNPILKMKNIQFKKIIEGSPEKNVKRSTEEIAELIYYKEIEIKSWQ